MEATLGASRKINKANASHYAKIGNQIRWAAFRAQKLAAQIASQNPSAQQRPLARVASDDPRRLRILKQIDALDKDFDQADAALRVKITASKARLWELLFPKPGSFRPRAERGSKRTAQDEPEADSEA